MTRCTKRMRRWRIGLGSLVVGSLCVMQLVLPLQAKAQQELCTLAILQGGYIFENSGFVVEGQNAIPLATAGRLQIGAAGNVTGVFVISAAGRIDGNLTLTGTATLQPNCVGGITGTDSDGDPVNAVIFVDPLTGNFTALITNPGNVRSFFLRKDGT